MGATNPDAHGSHHDLDDVGLFCISKVGLNELSELGMAKEAHAGPLNSGLTTRFDIAAGEGDKTS